MAKRILSLSLAVAAGLVALLAVLALARRPDGVVWAPPASTTLTVGSDCVTIQACVDAARPGDEVHIPAGNYTESVTVHWPISLTGDLSSTTIIHAIDGQRVMTMLIGPVYLSEVMLTGGFISPTLYGDCGGALLITGTTSARLHNVALINNTAYCGGGLGLF